MVSDSSLPLSQAPPTYPFPSHVNSVHVSQSDFLKINFSVNPFICDKTFQVISFFQVCPPKLYMHLFRLPYLPHAPPPPFHFS